MNTVDVEDSREQPAVTSSRWVVVAAAIAVAALVSVVLFPPAAIALGIAGIGLTVVSARSGARSTGNSLALGASIVAILLGTIVSSGLATSVDGAPMPQDPVSVDG
jgi:hypothetical protein